MGRPINTEARKIVLQVIKFCEDEKQYGLLAPREEAIKRACLATGLCEAAILEIKKEAQNVNEQVDAGCRISQDAVGAGISEGVTNEKCRNETPVTSSPPAEIATVLVKVEPMEEITDEVAAKNDTETDPGYLVPIKTEPVDEDEKDLSQAANMAVDVKCEFTSESEYTIPMKKIRLDQRCEGNQEGSQQPVIVDVKCEVQDDDPLKTSPGQCEQGGAAESEPEPKRKPEEKSNNKTQDQSPRNTNQKKEGRFQCDVCKTSFRQMVILQRHVITHTGEKPYECDICHNRFSQNINLQRHRKTHTGEKPYECNVCHSRFSQNINLKRHLKTHTGEKPFECHICHSRFSQKVHLQQHVKIHGGEKQYECDVCKRWFAYKTSLQRHYRTHIVQDEKS